MKTKITLLMIMLALFSWSNNANAQNGSLDNTFDTDGKLTTPIGSASDYGKSVAIQSDGKIVVAGYSTNGSYPDFALVRYNSDGTLDNTFSSDGKLTTPIGSAGDYGNSVAIQSDGKIVVAGYSGNGSYPDFALVRYNSNGTLDNTFDTDGKLTTDFGINSSDYGNSVAIQSDGKIVVVGTSTIGASVDFALVRYNTDGTLDNTFDTDGKLTTPIGSSDDYCQSVAIQSDGKIVVAGYSTNGGTIDFALARYNSNGTLDNTFDIDGKLTTAIGSLNDYGYSVAIQSDGKIVVAGTSQDSSYMEDFALIRYNSNGSLDNTFDTDGKLTTDFGSSNDFGYSVAIQSDGKIVVAGLSENDGTPDFALAQYNSDGTLDNTFDTDGKLTTPIGSLMASGYSIAIQSDGKIVVAGDSYNSATNYDFAVVRYNNIITSIAESINNNDFIIYPNPSVGKFTINITGKINSLEIYNLLGEKVLEQKNTNEINLSNSQKGIYFVKIYDGEKTHTQKIIVQ